MGGAQGPEEQGGLTFRAHDCLLGFIVELNWGTAGAWETEGDVSLSVSRCDQGGGRQSVGRSVPSGWGTSVRRSVGVIRGGLLSPAVPRS